MRKLKTYILLPLIVLLSFAVEATGASGDNRVLSEAEPITAPSLKIIEKIITKAEQGDVYAQFVMGNIFSLGNGTPKDFKEALKWFSKAAEKGDAKAQYSLGRMYENGEGVPKDSTEAIKWFSKAAEQGVTMAQISMGRAFLLGSGVKKSDKVAAVWLEKAAEKGDYPYSALAQSILARMYSKGNGVPKDYVLAYKWYNLSTGNSETATFSAEDRKSFSVLEKKMTAEQIAEGQRLSREMTQKWKEKNPSGVVFVELLLDVDGELIDSQGYVNNK